MWVKSSVTPSATATAPVATATSTPVTSPVRVLMPTVFPSAGFASESRIEHGRDVRRTADDPEPYLPPGPRAQRREVQLSDVAVGRVEGRQQARQLRPHQARGEPGDLAL